MPSRGTMGVPHSQGWLPTRSDTDPLSRPFARYNPQLITCAWAAAQRRRHTGGVTIAPAWTQTAHSGGGASVLPNGTSSRACICRALWAHEPVPSDAKPVSTTHSTALNGNVATRVHKPAPQRHIGLNGLRYFEGGQETYPAEHGPEQFAFVSPLVAPNTPTGHGLHDASPARLYRPALHTLTLLATEPASH